MIADKYFVMMFNQKGTVIMPLIDDEDEVSLFDTREAAVKAAEGNPYAAAFGYHVHSVSTEDCEEF